MMYLDFKQHLILCLFIIVISQSCHALSRLNFKETPTLFFYVHVDRFLKSIRMSFELLLF